jgi:hypothetical protein
MHLAVPAVELVLLPVSVRLAPPACPPHVPCPAPRAARAARARPLHGVDHYGGSRRKYLLARGGLDAAPPAHAHLRRIGIGFQDLGRRVWDMGFGVQGSEFSVQGLGFGV